jgi:hypothetical protein
MDKSTIETLELIIKALSVLGVIFGGGWAIYRYFIFTESFPKLSFNVDLLSKLIHKNCHLCEVVAEIENVGNVRVEITKMSFTLHGLTETDPIDESQEKINFQAEFPNQIKVGSWFPQKKWESTFVETKTKQIYRFVCSVPLQMKAVVVHGRIEYSGSYHTANKLVHLVPSA